MTLTWTPAGDETDTAARRHYERFLYRVTRFSSLFDWFAVGRPELLEESRVVGAERLYLNVAGDRSKVPAGDDPVLSEADGRKSVRQSELEAALLKDPKLLEHYEMSADARRDRQFPVGLYSTDVPIRSSAVFPGGKGAIDLVCLDRGTLWLFEIKAERNIPIGTVTELLFYTSVLREAVAGLFTFAEGESRRAVIRGKDLANVRKIRSVMLGHNLHPLIADLALIDMLNEAVEHQWNREPGRPHVRFGAGQIKSKQGEVLDIKDFVAVSG